MLIYKKNINFSNVQQKNKSLYLNLLQRRVQKYKKS